MSKSIQEQRDKIRAERNPKRFHDVRRLKINSNKIKAKNKKQKIKDVYRAVEELLGEDYYLPKKKRNKKKKRVKRDYKKLPKELTDRQIKYRDYLLSSEWVQLRIDLIKFRGYICERCPNIKNLHVHHKHYDNIFNEEPEDLEIICSSCHAKEHGKKK
jgi:hypothetical protein